MLWRILRPAQFGGVAMSDPLPVIYTEFVEIEPGKGLFDGRGRLVTKIGRLDDTQLATNLQGFCDRMADVFDQVSGKVRDFDVTSFELSVEVTAGGEVRMIGGVSTEVTGGLRLTFTRRATSES
jgi:hypothetical protein